MNNESPLPLPIHIAEPPPANFVVGKLEGFDANDPTFELYSEATRYALERSTIKNPLDFYDEAWGVWNGHNAKCVAIAYIGALFEVAKHD